MKKRNAPAKESCAKRSPLTVREKIMEAAIELFAQQGIEKTSVRQIVSRVKVTKPVLYYYFKSKDDLCREIFRFNIKAMRAAMDELQKGDKTFEEVLSGVFSRMFELFRRKPESGKFAFYSIYMGTHKNKVYEAMLHDYLKAQRAVIMEIIEAACRRGEICKKDTADVFNVIRAFLNFLIISSNYREDFMALDKATPTRFAQLVCRGICRVKA